MAHDSLLTHQVKPSLAFFRVVLFCFEMSSTLSSTCVDALFSQEFVLSSWERYFESTVHVLGNSRAICSLTWTCGPRQDGADLRDSTGCVKSSLQVGNCVLICLL
jgi:hypothetical protein